MARYNQVTSSFSGGLVSKSMYGRIDLDRTKDTGRKFQNFFPTLQGPAEYRQGFKYCSTESTDVNDGIASTVITLENNETYRVVFLNNTIKIYDKDDVLKGTVATEYGASQLQDLRFSSEVNKLTICHPNHRPKILSAAVDFVFNSLRTSEGTDANSDGQITDGEVTSNKTLQTSEGTDANADGRILSTSHSDALGNQAVDGEVTSNRPLRTTVEVTGDTSWSLTDYTFFIEPFLDKDTTGAKCSIEKSQEIQKITSSNSGEFTLIKNDWDSTAGGKSASTFSQDWWVEFSVDGIKALGRVIGTASNYAATGVTGSFAPTNTVVYVDAVDYVTTISDESAKLFLLDNKETADIADATAKAGAIARLEGDDVASGVIKLRSDTAVFNGSQVGSFIRLDPADMSDSVVSKSDSTTNGLVRWVKVKEHLGQAVHAINLRGPGDMLDAALLKHFYSVGSVYKVFGPLDAEVDFDNNGDSANTVTGRIEVSGNRTFTWNGGTESGTPSSTQLVVGDLSASISFDELLIDTDATGSNNGVTDTVTSSYIKIEEYNSGTNTDGNLIVPTGTLVVEEIANNIIITCDTTGIFEAGKMTDRYFKGNLPTGIVYAKILAYLNTTQVRAILRSPIPIDSNGNIENDGQLTDFNLGAFYDANFPGTTAKFERRRIFGGTQANPNYIFMSKVDDEADFAPLENDKTLLDTTGISYQLGNVSANTQWLIASKDLVIGTSRGVYRIVPNQFQYAISPKTIRIELSDNVNCKKDASLIGTSVFFPDESNSLLMEYKYDGQIQQTNANDLSKFIYPTFVEDTILKVITQETPQSRVWVLTNSGVLYCLTYHRGEKFYAWNKLVTDGVVKDITIIRQGFTSGIDEVFITVQRTHNSVVYTQNESLYTDVETTSDKRYYLDGSVTGTVGVGVSTIQFSGPYTSGSLSVVVNGIYKGEYSVTGSSPNYSISGVTVAEGDTWVIGKKYTGELQMAYPVWNSTNKPAFGVDTTRVVSQKLYIVDGHKYKVGINDRTQEVSLSGITGSTSTLPTAFTGFDKEKLIPGSTFGDDNTPTITQDEPYQLTIASIVTKTDLN